MIWILIILKINNTDKPQEFDFVFCCAHQPWKVKFLKVPMDTMSEEHFQSLARANTAKVRTTINVCILIGRSFFAQVVNITKGQWSRYQSVWWCQQLEMDIFIDNNPCFTKVLTLLGGAVLNVDINSQQGMHTFTSSHQRDLNFS